MQVLGDYEALRNAIVMQACEDYVTCKKALATGHPAWGHISNTQKELDNCIEFFRGPQYRKYVDVNEHPELAGDKILKRLDEMAERGEINPETGNYYQMQGFFGDAY